MTGDSPQNVEYLMRRSGAPEPVELARGKVWRASEVCAYFASISHRGPDGRRLGRAQGQGGGVYTPMMAVRVGQVLAAGEVTAIRYSPSGKTVYFTCRDAGGAEKEGRGRDAAGKITVFTEGPPGT